MRELDKEVASGRMQLPDWFGQITFASFNCHSHGNPAEARLADHLYLVFSAPPEGLDDDEFVAWYREHADENTQVPGFLANWRFRLEPEVIDPTSETVATHLALYEVDRDLATLRANLGAARVTNEAGWPVVVRPDPVDVAGRERDRRPGAGARQRPGLTGAVHFAERIPCPYARHRPSAPITSAACSAPAPCCRPARTPPAARSQPMTCAPSRTPRSARRSRCRRTSGCARSPTASSGGPPGTWISYTRSPACRRPSRTCGACSTTRPATSSSPRPRCGSPASSGWITPSSAPPSSSSATPPPRRPRRRPRS